MKKILQTIKRFCKTVKLFLQDKTMTQNKITLIDKNILITNDEKVAETINILNYPFYWNCCEPKNPRVNSTPLDDNQILIWNTDKYKNNPSIIENPFPSHSFVFKTVSRDGILKDIKNLDLSKATQERDIPKKTAKENDEISQIFCILLLTSKMLT